MGGWPQLQQEAWTSLSASFLPERERGPELLGEGRLHPRHGSVPSVERIIVCEQIRPLDWGDSRMRRAAPPPAGPPGGGCTTQQTPVVIGILTFRPNAVGPS